MNTSATGGYLLPDGGTVPNDQDLEDIFQGFIRGVTGIAGSMVRPRFQTVPLPMPAVGEDWVAFGIKSQRQDNSPYFDQHDENATSIRHEDIEVALSFYGNNGQKIAKQFIDGTAIPQNIDQLKLHKIKFIGVTDVITAPDLLNEQYVHRFDVTATFRRKTERTYAVQSFQGLSQIKIN
ncbi:phage neck terminator protein [Acinetobacter sp. KS-LM10]|uniref:phage neck terminator protein n=1 Tax=Acinetobacter sp. KS-LM10 TaxID=3120518 RepID=UPI0030D0044C